MNVYEYVFRSVGNATMPLDRWRGQPLLLVNTASKCGYTPQLRKLEAIWQDYRHSNLVVIGMPCNDFGEQEPAREQAISGFYWDNYHVTFPLTAKIVTRGMGSHPLFLALMDAYGQEIMPRWNFNKYLFNSKGDLVEHWPSGIEPDDPLLTHQIERNLNSWVF
jgi:glutathione peroxidase